MLAKSKRVLDLVEQDAECAWFSNEAGAEEDDVTQLTLPTSDWNQFGNPEQITVTIEPGDQLNTGPCPEHGGEHDRSECTDGVLAIDNVETS